MSGDCRDMEKCSEAGHRCWRTKAIASEKVGRGLAYHAAVRTGIVSLAPSRWAPSVTQAKRPKSTGVVRAMARSDHWRWVSTPRCARASWKVTSSCQRRTNQAMIWVGATAGSVHNKAWELSSHCGVVCQAPARHLVPDPPAHAAALDGLVVAREPGYQV